MRAASGSDVKEILVGATVIAVVGFSHNASRPSHGVARVLQDAGYRIVPVNPGLAGQIHLGEQVYGSLAEIPKGLRVDMVDIFRRSEAVPEVVDEALAHLPDLKGIWMQIGVEHAEAAARARSRGLIVVENRCPAIELPRLGLL